MSGGRVPSTPAVLQLRAANIDFTPHFYLPVYVERTVLEPPAITINGGSRGFLVRIAPQAVVQLPGARPVEVAIAQ
jgi:prolyl-tRNA editing enzyme YbaK/EbsC (Cys-tRNA(Pro) deacylase)